MSFVIPKKTFLTKVPLLRKSHNILKINGLQLTSKNSHKKLHPDG